MLWTRLSPTASIAVALITVISIAAGYQNNKFKGDGQDVFDLGPGPTSEGLESSRIGFRYRHVGVAGVDFFRHGGQVVMFENHGSYLSYVDVDEATADELGVSAPWRYYLPEGLLALACIAELLVVSRKPRTIRFALIAGGVLAAVAIVLRIQGLTWECVFPALLAIHHLATGVLGLRDSDEPIQLTDDSVVREKPLRSSRARGPAPTFEKDPFRAPPQAPPIVVHRPSTEPASVPVDHDANADAPKLLR